MKKNKPMSCIRKGQTKKQRISTIKAFVLTVVMTILIALLFAVFAPSAV